MEESIILCSAVPEELSCFSETKISKSIYLGIGYLSAAQKLEQIIQEKKSQNLKINKIIFCGTAGSYNTNIDLLSTIKIHTVALLELGKLTQQGFSPANYPHYSNSNQLNPNLCLSSLEITNNIQTAKTIYGHYSQKFGALNIVENMELYGIAYVADQHHINWEANLVITNYCNSNAHEDWLKNKNSAYKLLPQMI